MVHKRNARLSMLSAILMATVAIGPMVLVPAAQAQTTAGQNFNIPAQSLADALVAFGVQSGHQVTVDGATIRGVHSNGVHGLLPAEQALNQLLSSTGFTYNITGNVVTIERMGQSANDATQLKPVLVEGNADNAYASEGERASALLPEYAGGQVARGGRVGLLGNTDFMDTPFNQTSYTSGLIENQQAQSLADVLVNDPAVQDLGVRYGPTGDGMFVRGLSNSSNLGGVTFNGMQAGAMYKQSPELYERVEILKGLDALLNGMTTGGNLGGNINLVPKRAEDTPITRLTGSFFSRSQLGGHVDFGRRFGDSNEWGIRVNGLYRDGETPVRKRDSRVLAGTMGIDYQGERLRASLDILYQDKDIDNAQPVLSFASSVIPKAPSGDSPILLGQNISNQKDKSVVFRSEYDFTNNLTGFVGVSRSKLRAENTGAASVTNIKPNGDFTARVRALPYAFDSDNVQGGLRGSFNTGSVQHRAVLSFDYVHQDTAIRQDNSGWGDFVSGNIYSVTTAIAPTFAFTAPWVTNQKTRLSSVAVADTLSFNQDQVLLTLGARGQRVKDTNVSTETSYNKSAITPMAGLVIKPISDLSVYANYIEGLQQGASVTDTSAPNFGKVFSPYRSRQYEIGTKWDLGNFATTISLFQISQPSLIQDTTTLNYEPDGKQRNRGVEWNLFGKVDENLGLLGGLAFTDAKLVKTAGGVNDGNKAQGVARFKANLNAEWTVPGVPDLSLNGRIIYSGPVYINATNTQKLGAWTRYDAGARYTVNIGKTPITLRANVENLLNDKRYNPTSIGFVTLAAPRTFLFSVTADL